MISSLTLFYSLLLGADDSVCRNHLKELALLKEYYLFQEVDHERVSGNFWVGQHLLSILETHPQEASDVLEVLRSKGRLFDVMRGLGATLSWKRILKTGVVSSDLVFESLKNGIVLNLIRLDRSSEQELNYFYEVEIAPGRFCFFSFEDKPGEVALYMRGTAMFQAIEFAKLGKSFFKMKRDKKKSKYFSDWLSWLDRRNAYVQLELELVDTDKSDQTFMSFHELESRTRKSR